MALRIVPTAAPPPRPDAEPGFARFRRQASQLNVRRLAKRAGAYADHASTTVPRIRLILAATALLVTFIDPTEPATRVAGTYATLTLYVVYSAVLRFLRMRGISRIRRAYWIDVAWVTVLVTLSGGANSIFFFLYLFAILTASFDRGYSNGMAVALVSVAAFITISATPATSPDLEVNWFLLRSMYLIVLGHMIATWGESEISLRKRLVLLKDAGVVSNPRFGTDHVVGTVLDRLRTFFGGARCVLVVADAESEEYLMREAADTDAGARPVRIDAALADILLQLPPRAVVVRSAGHLWGWGTTEAFDVATASDIAVDWSLIDRVTALLDGRSLMTVPLRYDAAAVGRLYVASPARAAFGTMDVDFLLQATDHLALALQNIRLVDSLASTAADHERQRIARDIHDTVLQPYVGLHMGLSALHKSLVDGHADALAHVERLMRLTASEMSGVRAYASDLRVDAADGPMLESAIRRFAVTLSSAAGIEVGVRISGRLSLPDRVAAEVFQIVVEALNNVRRHTDATSAQVEVERTQDRLVIRVTNPARSADGRTFAPKTIVERTVSLGGVVSIDTSGETTMVQVEIPA